MSNNYLSSMCDQFGLRWKPMELMQQPSMTQTALFTYSSIKTRKFITSASKPTWKSRL